jgi:hypothetical protein
VWARHEVGLGCSYPKQFMALHCHDDISVLRAALISRSRPHGG